jgi:hypothetical protein
MAEVELSSELLILGIAGLQDKKNSINDFYANYDSDIPDRAHVEMRFRRTIDEIVRTCGDLLPTSEFRRPPLFYSLYGAVYHRLFGLPRVRLRGPKSPKLSNASAEALVDAAVELSHYVEMAKTDDEGDVPRKYQPFVSACLRQTDNIRPRSIRLTTLYKRAFAS